MPRPRERPDLTPQIRAWLGQVRKLGKDADRLQGQAWDAWARRGEIMLQLLEAGFSEHQLAAELDLTQPTVHEIVAKARERRG